MNRAYSILTVKSVQEDNGVMTITGLASTPTPDRMGDIVKPDGAKFTLPIPLLWQHDSNQPIGNVIKAKVTKAGIEVVATITMGILGQIDRAATLIKAGLVRGLSIGFRGLDTEQIPNSWGVIFNSWEWLELSAVTIPANAEATITSIKSADTGIRAALGIQDTDERRPVPPGASGKSSNNPDRPKEGKMNISAKIAELEGQRTEKALRFEAIQKTAMDGNRSKTEQEKTEFDALRTELKEIDDEVKDLKDVEALTVVKTAKPVGGNDERSADRSRDGRFVPATVEKKLDPGIAFVRLMKIKAVSKLEIMPQIDVAAKMYGQDSQAFQLIRKANEVLPGDAASGNWAYDLISQEGAPVADFVEFLRSQMIVGKFGTNGIPALNGGIGFYEPYVIQTGGGAGYWVGEAKPKPLTSFDFDRSTLTPLKMANIAVLSEENLRRSSPKSDVIIRDQLVRALVELEDTSFIDPSNSGSANVKPASISNGAPAIVATGTGDADDIRLDVRALLHKYTTAHNPPRNGVLIMSSDSAIALGTMVNALGQPEFPGISLDGGRLLTLPVIVSDYVGTNVVMVNASDIYYVDEGVSVDTSNQVSLEMKSASLTQDGSAGTGAALVSMWQNNMVAYRAEMTVNWKKRRSSAVAYLTSVAWGGAVPNS